jgi:S-adenosylmethionine hydrolase
MPDRTQVITLITDFGDNYYVGEMKGVIKKVNPLADIVDVTHAVSRQNIVGGAFVLSRILHHFPNNTIHVAVVDPGVGTSRKSVAIETKSCILIGPDNGILRWALKDLEIVRAVELDHAKVQSLARLSGIISSTFHGRDVFAPAAGLLSRGVDLDSLGSRATELEKLELLENIVVHIDGFGNIITTVARNITPGKKVRIIHGARHYDATAVRTFGEVEPDRLVVLTGSHGLLEVDVNQGDAAQRLGVKAGDSIRIEDVS